MNLDEYQTAALTTAAYPTPVIDVEVRAGGHGGYTVDLGYVYPALMLAEEAGEVAGKCAKLIRDKEGIIAEADRETIKKELGDVLWGVAVLAHEFGLSLDAVATANVAKLADRKARGVIGGSGDNR